MPYDWGMKNHIRRFRNYYQDYIRQRELADTTGINGGRLCQIESGEAKPRPDEMDRIARGLTTLLRDAKREPTHRALLAGDIFLSE